MATITFHELESVSWFRERRLMRSVLLELFKKEGVALEALDFIFCNDEYLLQINQQFLQHNDYTDIITFDLSSSFPSSKDGSSKQASSKDASSKEGSSKEAFSKQASSKEGYSKEGSSKEASSKQASSKEGEPKVGEIYISVERVKENAQGFGISKEEELRRVMFHGCLHLCGYKDKLNDQKTQMRKMEDKYLRLYKQRST